MLDGPADGSVTIQLFDGAGKQVATVGCKSLPCRLQLPADAKGSLHYRLMDGNQVVKTGTLLVAGE